MKRQTALLWSALIWGSNSYAINEVPPPISYPTAISIDPVLPIVDSIDLKTALSSAYMTNENIKTAQQKFLIEAEEFPRALSGFLPDVSMNIKSSKNKQNYVSQYAKGSSENGNDIARSLDVTQNIFNGGRSISALKIAQAGFLVSKSTLYSSEQKALTAALEAYLELWGAIEKYNIAVTAVEFYTQNLNMVREKNNVGTATITDLAAAEAELAKADSTKSQQFAELRSAQAAFQAVIGVPATNKLSFPSNPDNMPENLDSFKAVVEKSNFDLIAAKSGLSQSKDEIRLAQGALLPKVDLSVSAGRNYYDPENVNNSRVNNRSLSTAVSVKVPILTNGGIDHSRVREAKYRSRQAIYSVDYAKKQVLASVTSSWEEFLSMKDAMISAEEAIKAQSIALEGTRSGYEVGTQTMLDVLQQQDKLDQLKSQVIDVKTKYLRAAYAIKGLMGEMTAQRLNLAVQYFSPEQEFRNLKHKIVGF